MKQIKDKAMQKDEELEKCICCKDIVQVSKKTPISMRPYYVEGAGQLCRLCYEELYGTKDVI